MGDEPQRKLALEYFEQAFRHQRSGELQEAIEDYKKSIRIHPTAEAHTFLGWTYSFLGRNDEAIEECLKAIDVDPTFGNPYNDIGAYLIGRGQLHHAIPWLQKAIAAPRYESRCYPYFNLGRIYLRMGRWLEAIQQFKSALQENPAFADARIAIAQLRARLN